MTEFGRTEGRAAGERVTFLAQPCFEGLRWKLVPVVGLGQ
jgi:hypothetical protein